MSCGSRTEILSDTTAGGGPGGSGDGGATTDGMAWFDGPTFADGPNASDAGIVCTKPVVMVGFGCDNNKMCCKMSVEWMCGTTHYRVGGACEPYASAQSGFIGVCDRNGVQTGTITDHDPNGCSCTDVAKTAALVAKECGYQPGTP